jgi:hypothetical protein
MAGVRQRLIGLVLPAVPFWALDVTVTLVGQHAGYWQGYYWEATEGSPTFFQLLTIHPLAFVAGSIAWLAVFAALIVLLPDTLALMLSLAVAFAHTAGALTWIRQWPLEYRYQVSVAVLVCCAMALGLGIRWGWQASPRVVRDLPISPRWRWMIAAVLGALAAYLYLWPRHPWQ